MAANARLFARWLELTQERKERKLLKKKPTNTEAEYISSALAQASEEELLQMLDWAFHGTDSYAKFIQGKTSFDAKAPQEYLSIPSLFKDTRLDRRIALGDEWANRPEPAQVTSDWLEKEALPALDRLIDSPESYQAGYDWWCQTMPRHDGGPTEDRDYINALLKLREFRAGSKS